MHLKKPEKDLPESVLKLILKELIKELNSESFSLDDLANIYDGGGVSDFQSSLISTLKKFGMTSLEYEHFGFFSKLIELNVKNIDGNLVMTDGKLIIPKTKSFNLFFEVGGKRWFTEEWVLNIKSYDEKFVISMYYNGDYSYYDGEILDEDISDTDVNDIDIIKIMDVTKRDKLQETVEPKKEIIRLKKLKEAIEKKIELLSK